MPIRTIFTKLVGFGVGSGEQDTILEIKKIGIHFVFQFIHSNFVKKNFTIEFEEEKKTT